MDNLSTFGATETADLLGGLYEIEIDDSFLSFNDDTDEASVSIRYDDEEDDEEGEYSSKFGLYTPPMAKEHVYDMRQKELARETGVKISESKDMIKEAGFKEPTVDYRFDSPADTGAIKTDYGVSMDWALPPGYGANGYVEMKTDVMHIEYTEPGSINGQETYQRIVFQADYDGQTVYDLTMRKLGGAGIQASAKHDPEFDSIIFTSINGRRENQDGSFNEFYMNGAIGDNAADRQALKKGDIVEWRYAKETDGSCGGTPDFQTVRNMLEQYTNGGVRLFGPQHLLPSPMYRPVSGGYSGMMAF